MNHSKQSNGTGPVKGETVYQFDTLMKELNERVTFTCNAADDEENSNETDSILTQSSKNNNKLNTQQFNNQHMYHASSLPSIDSLIGQQQQQQQQQMHANDNQYIKLNNHLVKDNHHDHNDSTNQNVEMEWNETEFLQMCQDLDETDHLFNNKQLQHQQQVYHNQQSYSMHQHQTNTMKQTTNNLTFNEDTSILNFDLNQHRLEHTDYNNGNLMNESGAKTDPLLKSCVFIDNNNTNLNTNNSTNNTNSATNMMMPWEFDNSDFNQIANYLQSPTV